MYACRNVLQGRLPAEYDATVSEQIRLIELPPEEENDADAGRSARDIYPDVSVTRDQLPTRASVSPAGGTATLQPVTLPAPSYAQVRDPCIEVVRTPGREL